MRRRGVGYAFQSSRGWLVTKSETYKRGLRTVRVGGFFMRFHETAGDSVEHNGSVADTIRALEFEIDRTQARLSEVEQALRHLLIYYREVTR